MKKYCLTLDLKDDPQLIEEYKSYHENVWPEVIESIETSGISSMEIYLLGNRLCMLVEVEDTFSFQEKAEKDKANQKVQQWEELMWKYQQGLPLAQPGEKWMLMDKIFDLSEAREELPNQ
ncbi:MAG: L-fucose mutarotase [Roseivirga sp.]